MDIRTERDTEEWIGRRVAPLLKKAIKLVQQRSGPLVKEVIDIVSGNMHHKKWHVQYGKKRIEFRTSISHTLFKDAKDEWLRSLVNSIEVVGFHLSVSLVRYNQNRWAVLEYRLDGIECVEVSGFIEVKLTNSLYEKIAQIIENRPDLPGVRFGQNFAVPR